MHRYLSIALLSILITKPCAAQNVSTPGRHLADLKHYRVGRKMLNNGDSITLNSEKWRLKSLSKFEVSNVVQVWAKLENSKGKFYFPIDEVLRQNGYSLVDTNYHPYQLVDTNIKERLLGILPLKGEDVVYEFVIPAPGKTRSELFKLSKLWLVDAFNSAKAVTQFEDSTAGKIVGKGIDKVFWQWSALGGTDVSVHETIQIDLKEGKAKIKIYSLSCVYYAEFSNRVTSSGRNETPIERFSHANTEVFRKENTMKFFGSVNESTLSTVRSFAEYITKNSPSESDW